MIRFRILFSLPLVVAAIATSGCDDMTEDASEAFDDGFASEFVATCTPKIVSAGAPELIARKICTCAANQANEEMTMTEKMGGGVEKIEGIMEACIEKFDATPAEPVE